MHRAARTRVAVPIGVGRNDRIYSTGWRAKTFLKEGIGLTYPWIEAQVKAWTKRRQASA